MPRLDYKTCRVCGKHADEVGELSHTRLCIPCGQSNLRAAVLEQKNHNGPTFQHWRRRIAASVGASILDDVTLTP
jgi:hypothetical protein